jgi:hypothetical protein
MSRKELPLWRIVYGSQAMATGLSVYVRAIPFGIKLFESAVRVKNSGQNRNLGRAVRYFSLPPD